MDIARRLHPMRLQIVK